MTWTLVLSPSTGFDTVATNLVHAARGSDVSMVMVDGRIVVNDSRLADRRWDDLNDQARQVGMDLLEAVNG